MRESLKNMKLNEKTFIEEVRFVIMDVETTGLDPKNDRICEISMNIIKDFKEAKGLTTLVNPGVSIPYDVSKIHGITDSMVLKSPKFGDIVNQILDIIYDSVLVGHNIDFDYNFLKSEFERIGYSIPDIYVIDTLDLSRRFCGGLPNYKLETVARSMNLFSKDWHRAENDVIMTSRIFENILNILVKENGVMTLEDLLKMVQ